jgi:hypothetical protein
MGAPSGRESLAGRLLYVCTPALPRRRDADVARTAGILRTLAARGVRLDSVQRVQVVGGSEVSRTQNA